MTSTSVRRPVAFDWSRTSANGHKVFIADKDAYATLGVDITPNELAHSLHIHNKVVELHVKKQIIRNGLFLSIALIPVVVFFINILGLL
jgi:hypothetical protein